MPESVVELLATEAAVGKLGARSISTEEVEQLPRNRHVLVRNPRPGGTAGGRRLLIGRTHGGRVLTVVIERTIDPTTWLIVTGWTASPAERTLLESS